MLHAAFRRDVRARHSRTEIRRCSQAIAGAAIAATENRPAASVRYGYRISILDGCHTGPGPSLNDLTHPPLVMYYWNVPKIVEDETMRPVIVIRLILLYLIGVGVNTIRKLHEGTAPGVGALQL